MWPIFEAIINNLIDKANANGLPVGLHMGLRTWEQQDALYALGRTVQNKDGITPETPMGRTVTRAPGGLSWHNYGLAADLVFRTTKGAWSWAPNWPWERLGRLGESLGVEWGNAMGPDKMEAWDKPHFQLTHGLHIQVARELYREGGLEEVWANVAQRSRK